MDNDALHRVLKGFSQPRTKLPSGSVLVYQISIIWRKYKIAYKNKKLLLRWKIYVIKYQPS